MFLPAMFCPLVIADIVAAQQFFATKFAQRLFARHFIKFISPCVRVRSIKSCYDTLTRSDVM